MDMQSSVYSDSNHAPFVPPDKFFKCNQCPAIFPHIEFLSNHILLHNKGAKKLICRVQQCGWAVACNAMRFHWQSHHPHCKVECEKCGAHIYSPSTMTFHNRLHKAGNIGTTCKECGWRVYDLNYHESVWHPEKQQGTAEPTQDLQQNTIRDSENGILAHHCTKCKFYSKVKSGLTNHYLVHRPNASSIDCEICGWRVSKKRLKLHMDVHHIPHCDAANKNQNNIHEEEDVWKLSSINQKPSFSYSQLIHQALALAPTHQLKTKEIYSHIARYYPYYKMTDRTWKISINLSLDRTRNFSKVSSPPNEPVSSFSLNEIDHNSSEPYLVDNSSTVLPSSTNMLASSSANKSNGYTIGTCKKGKPRYDCLQCPYHSKFESQIQQHMPVHEPNAPCTICDICKCHVDPDFMDLHNFYTHTPRVKHVTQQNFYPHQEEYLNNNNNTTL